MFNKIINKDKIVKEMKSKKYVTIANSRQEEIGIIIYDNVNDIEKGTDIELRFSFDNSPLDYFFKINFNRVLMYDTKKNQLMIKAI